MTIELHFTVSDESHHPLSEPAQWVRAYSYG